MSRETVDDLFARYGAPYRALVTAAGMTASFTMVISSTIVNVAIPDVMGTFGVGQDQAQLMATAFNVAMTTSQLLNAWVVATFGQRIGFVGTLVLFTVGSLLSGLSPDFYTVVFGRVLQGIAAGVIQPLVMVTIFQVFPSDRRGFAMGIYGMGLSLAVAVGPAIGGIAIEVFDWRFIFFFTLPLVALAFFLGLIFMPSVRAERRPPFDWTGYVLLLLSVGCAMTALTDALRHGWTSNYISGLIAVAATTGTAFIFWQMRQGPKLVDVTLFRHKQFTAAAIIAFIFGIGNFGTGYAVPVFGQLVQGMTALDAGFLVMPAALLVVAMLPVTGRLADTISPRLGLLAGLLLFAVGTMPMAYADANTPYITLVLYTLVARSGMGFTMPFIMNTALRSLPPDRLNAGGGMVNFSRQLGGSLGINAWVVFVETRTRFHAEALTATQSGINPTSREFIDGVTGILGHAGVPAHAHHAGALHFLGQVVHAQAVTLAFQDGFWILAVAFLLAIIPAWTLKRR